MDLIYLRFYKWTEGDDYFVIIDHSSEINDEEALFRAQCRLSQEGYIITKVEFPYIQCYKFEQNRE